MPRCPHNIAIKTPLHLLAHVALENHPISSSLQAIHDCPPTGEVRPLRCHDTSPPPKDDGRKTYRNIQKFKAEIRTRRKADMARALKIPSLDNSPVNRRQLAVLRMVYDEITMYPSEAWMVLIAIIIRRAFKQVKNWFSNERQKNKPDDTVQIRTETGERLRLRPLALALCHDWSDRFFEEVVMIYHYRTLRLLHWKDDQAASRTRRRLTPPSKS